MLIGLHGRKSAGKDTVYERASLILADVLPVERASFADLLYRSAAASLGVTVEELQLAKNDPLARVDLKVPIGRPGVYRSKSWTVRQYLQHYGTEAHRDVFGQDFWVDAVDLTDHEGRVVFVTDVRFENEARAVKAAGGTVIRVVGPPAIEDAGDGHASEAGLPDELIDMTLNNTQRGDNFRSLDRLVDTVLKILLQAEALERQWEASS